ncbi:MAG: hypothetical protein AAGF73_17740, partial [Actinomycetota bacterium]
MSSVGKHRGRTWTTLCMALGLGAGVLVSVAVAVDDDSGTAQAAADIVEDFASNDYSGGSPIGATGWGESWTETNDSSVTPPIYQTGDMFLATPDRNTLRLQDLTGNGGERTIQRVVNLADFNPTNGGTGAKFSVTIVESDDGTNDEDAKRLSIRFWDGSAFIEVANIGDIEDGTRVSYILPPEVLIQGSILQFAPTTTTGWDDNDAFVIDDIKIEDAVPNPVKPVTCGEDIQIILDESGSINGSGGGGGVQSQDNVKAAVLAFLEGLQDTGASVRSFEFANQARPVEVPAGDSSLRPVDGETIGFYNAGYFQFVPPPVPYNPNSFDDATYAPGGPNGTGTFTNWEYALSEAANSGDSTPLYLFITDGVPNTVGTTGVPDGGNADDDGTFDQTANNGAAAAYDAIDQIKDPNGTNGKVIAVGVGQVTNPTNLRRLAQLVEPTEAPEIWTGGALDLSTVDVISVPDFDDLAEALAAAARSACSQQLLIDKVDANGAPITSPSVSFDTTVVGADPDQTNFEFLAPESAVVPTATASTDASGRATFEWSAVGSVSTPANWKSTASFAETIPAGFTVDLDNPGNCEVVPARNNEPVLSITDVSNGVATYVLDDGAFEFMAGDVVTCSVRNVPQGTLIIEKVTTGGDDTFGFTGAVSGSITTDEGVGQTSLQATLAVGTYGVTESMIPAGWGLASATCDNQSGTLNDNTLSGITVAVGQTTTCTFENAKVDVQIDKTVTSQPAFANGEYTVVYDVDVTNPGPGQTTYSLTDTPTFGTGATITNIAIGGDVTIDPYTAGDPIVSGKTIDEGVTDTYTVTVT